MEATAVPIPRAPAPWDSPYWGAVSARLPPITAPKCSELDQFLPVRRWGHRHERQGRTIRPHHASAVRTRIAPDRRMGPSGARGGALGADPRACGRPDMGGSDICRSSGSIRSCERRGLFLPLGPSPPACWISHDPPQLVAPALERGVCAPGGRPRRPRPRRGAIWRRTVSSGLLRLRRRGLLGLCGLELGLARRSLRRIRGRMRRIRSIFPDSPGRLARVFGRPPDPRRRRCIPWH